MARSCACVSTFLILPLLLASGVTFAGGLPAAVTEVVDGDTLRAQYEGKSVTVHLLGIDSPEMTQPFGNEAKRFMTDLAGGKQVTIDLRPVPENGIYSGVATLSDGTVLNREIVAAGLAWVREEDGKTDRELAGLAAKAIAGKKGLWADPVPLAPWDFRRDARRAGNQEKKPQTKEEPVVRALLHMSKAQDTLTFSLSFRSEIGEVFSPGAMLQGKRIDSLGIRISDASGKVLSQGSFRYG